MNASQQIDARIEELGDWRGATLARVRAVITEADSSLGGNTRRAIDIHEAEEIDEDALKELVRAAAALNSPA